MTLEVASTDYLQSSVILKQEPEVTYSGISLLKQMKTVFGSNFVTGLPCGELSQFIAASVNDQSLIFIPTANEREAVGVGMGAWLAGRDVVLFMQNSGLFESSNDIGSLLIACRVPALFLVSWRGAPGETATQHFATGTATRPLLDSFGMPYIIESTDENLKKLDELMKTCNLPGCILQRREHFNTLSYPDSPLRSSRVTKKGRVFKEDGKIVMNRETALDLVFAHIPTDAAVVSSTGLISRSAYHNHDSDSQFYNAGAFGLTSSIGVGFSICSPGRRVVVVEGDGSVLTNLGNLNLIGQLQQEGLGIILKCRLSEYDQRDRVFCWRSNFESPG